MSKLRNTFIATGVAAWLGGLATAFAISSCDIDTCSEMDPDDPLCHPDALTREDPGPTALTSIVPGECDRIARPSVHVVPVLHNDDYMLPVEVESVWFTHDGQTHEARCIHDGEECTSMWVAGYELDGPITVGTEYCDTTVEKTVVVERTPDGCHVETQFMLLEVSTRGCLTDRDEPGAPPPPPWSPVRSLSPNE